MSPLRFEVVKRVMYVGALGSTMPTKLFGANWMRQSKMAQKVLDSHDIAYIFVDVSKLPHVTQILSIVVGDEEVQLPILFVDGVAYKGVERIRGFAKSL